MDKREYKELSELAANGGTKAFARLYETVYREMYYTAFYTLCDDADAVELVTASARDGMYPSAAWCGPRRSSWLCAFLRRSCR